MKEQRKEQRKEKKMHERERERKQLPLTEADIFSVPKFLPLVALTFPFIVYHYKQLNGINPTPEEGGRHENDRSLESSAKKRKDDGKRKKLLLLFF